MIITNVMIFRSIATDAFVAMQAEDDMRCRPKTDGTPGHIISYDPLHISFKQAFICIAFTGMWFEAATHLYMVECHGDEKAREWDRLPYHEKLEKLGCADNFLLAEIRAFSKSRNELMHEKAHFNQKCFTTAQKEAVLAYKTMLDAEVFFHALKINKD